MRRHGPFMPHRLGPEEMEYTTLPEVLGKLASRFKPVELGYKPIVKRSEELTGAQHD
jgi:fructose 1,6-bisphosphate aldolase/phosphatase